MIHWTKDFLTDQRQIDNHVRRTRRESDIPIYTEPLNHDPVHSTPMVINHHLQQGNLERSHRSGKTIPHTCMPSV